MVKLIAIYKHPQDKEAFDKHYFETHAPFFLKFPGISYM